MAREITTHKLNGLNDALQVIAVDDRGNGNANHHYQIRWDVDPNDPIIHIRDFFFQNGPLQEMSINGISNESLLAVLIDRLQGFQSGDFKCRENAIALTHLEDAMHWLQHRTRGRLARGVEGTTAK
jgi:hypothetical protein